MNKELKLQPLVDAIQSIEDCFDLWSLNIEVQPYIWSYDGECLYINTDNKQEDLINHDGNTYSWETRGIEVSTDGYNMFTDCDSHCGYTTTIIVKKENEI